MTWSSKNPDASVQQEQNLDELRPAYAVQLVRQVNFGPLESKRYFVPADAQSEELIQANFQKLNS